MFYFCRNIPDTSRCWIFTHFVSNWYSAWFVILKLTGIWRCVSCGHRRDSNSKPLSVIRQPSLSITRSISGQDTFLVWLLNRRTIALSALSPFICSPVKATQECISLNIKLCVKAAISVAQVKNYHIFTFKHYSFPKLRPPNQLIETPTHFRQAHYIPTLQPGKYLQARIVRQFTENVLIFDTNSCVLYGLWTGRCGSR